MAKANLKPKSKASARAAQPVSKKDTPTAKAGNRSVPAQRILVAEDSPVTQDLLKLVLEQHGHTVDLVSDGEKALAALNAGSYDVALVDFHLPKLDGLEVAARFREKKANAAGPRFVAITADIKGLLGHTANCENFDDVVPKPLDLEEVLGVVERDCEKSDANKVKTEPALRATDSPRTPAPRSQQYELLRWPEDFNSERLSARGMHASLADGSFDAIMLNEPVTVRDLSVIWTTKTLHLLPVIDMSGSLPKQADLDGSKLSIDETGEIDRLVKSFHERRAKLHNDLIYTDDIGEKLIGRMFVCGGSLTPHYDAASSELFSYSAALDFRSIDKEMRNLEARGFVDREFFDRFHLCDRCGSSRFNVREECTECGSAHIEEEAYLHHFRCAYQGPESDFRQQDDLVCPKCRMELSHFSVDYDKPGTMTQCQSCRHATSEPAVAFVCTECEARYDGDSVRTRDVYAYELSELGLDFAKAGRGIVDGKHAALRFAELPLELIVAMNAELKKFESDQKPFALLSISYRNAREIEHKEGPRLFVQCRDLFVENLRNTVRKEDLVVKGQSYDFVLLKGADPDEAQAGLNDLLAETTASLRFDLGTDISVFGPEDFA